MITTRCTTGTKRNESFSLPNYSLISLSPATSIDKSHIRVFPFGSICYLLSEMKSSLAHKCEWCDIILHWVVRDGWQISTPPWFTIQLNISADQSHYSRSLCFVHLYYCVTHHRNYQLFSWLLLLYLLLASHSYSLLCSPDITCLLSPSMDSISTHPLTSTNSIGTPLSPPIVDNGYYFIFPQLRNSLLPISWTSHWWQLSILQSNVEVNCILKPTRSGLFINPGNTWKIITMVYMLYQFV